MESHILGFAIPVRFPQQPQQEAGCWANGADAKATGPIGARGEFSQTRKLGNTYLQKKPNAATEMMLGSSRYRVPEVRFVDVPWLREIAGSKQRRAQLDHHGARQGKSLLFALGRNATAAGLQLSRTRGLRWVSCRSRGKRLAQVLRNE